MFYQRILILYLKTNFLSSNKNLFFNAIGLRSNKCIGDVQIYKINRQFPIPTVIKSMVSYAIELQSNVFVS